MTLLPQGLFGRTALLIALTLLLFWIIAWQAIVWSALVPSADAAALVLAQRAQGAVLARRTGITLPAGMRFESSPPALPPRRYIGYAVRTYLETIRAELAAQLDAEVRINRYAGPAELWVRTPEIPGEWLVLTWRVAGPNAPAVSAALLASAAVLVLGAAAFSARRLTAPLAALAAAASRVAEGEPVRIDSTSGPSEVRALASAFQAMSLRLAELDQQREMMLGGVSHDLRTPLARLRVAVELLGGGQTGLTEEMTANIEEMDRMIGQFLHYVRANYRETPSRASLDDIARRTLAIYATDERLRLELQAPAQRTFAVDCVRHALLNLTGNALEYGAPPVTVTTSLEEAGVCLRVADRGPGLSRAEWARALEPFRRLGDQPAGAHTGLGLALIERLVRVSGGTLEAHQVQGGFVVSVRLPALATRPA